MEGGQVALFFVQWIFIFVQGVVVLKTLSTFESHLKPIRMKTFYTFEVNYFENDLFDFVTSVAADNFSEALTKVYLKSIEKAEGKSSMTFKNCYIA
jgi:hypothetical protein